MAYSSNSTAARCIARRVHTQVQAKKEGDISSVFVSLSGQPQTPLPSRFASIKRQLIFGSEDAVVASWKRLLKQLSAENQQIAQLGSKIIPQIKFEELHTNSETFKNKLKKRGVGVIKGVVPAEEARRYKFDIEDYVRANPETKAFPSHDPQVFELYWSPTQVKARAHSNVITAQKFLMDAWHSQNPTSVISTSTPLAYADRVRIRQPGDSGFALGPHVDGGSVERFEPNGYGLGDVYHKVWAGNWEEYDPWESSCRVPVVSDLYAGAGACSMFRMFQGWLGLSNTAPMEGTLMVNPSLQLSTAYFLLRPFFKPRVSAEAMRSGPDSSEFLDESNWILEPEMSPTIPGAFPGAAQELNDTMHPHLELGSTMIHVPAIQPGDFVVWHCDSIHAVDKTHMGRSDSSVMYIPVCPVTESNALYLKRQREAFLSGFPGPDFPGGRGESQHIGRSSLDYLQNHSRRSGLQAMGLARLENVSSNATLGQKEAIERANSILGFG